jgi:hypothetical protein
MMESEKEVWLHAGVEGEGMKTKMGVGEGSTMLPSHGGLHRGNIREWDRGEKTERFLPTLHGLTWPNYN